MIWSLGCTLCSVYLQYCGVNVLICPVQLLENMTEVVRKGILEAELQMQKDNEDKLMEEV